MSAAVSKTEKPLPVEPTGGTGTAHIFEEHMRKPSRDMVNAALRSIEVAEAQAGRPLIEETIGPAEVHTLGAPMQDEYVTVSRRVWHETCARCLDNELRAARLQQQVDDLHVQLEARDVVGYRKDQEYDALERRNRSLTRALWAAASILAVMALAVAWRAM